MKVLIGGEYSGTIRNAFSKLGHEAWSCDLNPTTSPGNHFKCNWWEVIDQDWDLGIFHPTCTYMANSGAKHLFKDRKKTGGLNTDRWTQMGLDAWEFWKLLNNAPIKHLAVENPIMLGYAQLMVGSKPTQIIQPWQYGHEQMKATGLWLKGLPKLVPTDIVGPPPEDKEERKAWQDIHFMAPTKDPEERRMARSKTFQGIADAMAIQWGALHD